MSNQLPLLSVKKKVLWFSPLVILALLVPIILKSGVSFNPDKLLTNLPPITKLTQSKPILETVLVEVGTLEKKVLLDGDLQAVRARTLFGKASESKITYMPPEGTKVNIGDRLVEFDNTPVSNRILEIKQQIITSENQLVEIQSNHESGLRDLEAGLSQYWLAFQQAKIDASVPINLVPRRDYQERQLLLEKTETEYNSHLAKIEKKKLEQQAELQAKNLEKEKLVVELQKLENQLNDLNLKAPSDGIVIYADHIFEPRKVQVGDVVFSGFPVINLPDLTELEILARVNEVDGPRLSIGQAAQVFLDSYPDIKINGKIKDISQTAAKAGTSRSDTTKIFKVVVSLEKTLTDIMKPGMSAQVEVNLVENTPKILVPRFAVEFHNKQAQVFKQVGEELQPIAINILASDFRFYAIADDGKLKQGDKLVINKTTQK
ncbi:MAG: HlyD family efflux transporter periplasmic adaptor subunit [Blastocatellia bacterium]|nr:HlyD family efflux transporter periplasmic adaptor subunit [Blastocatellia bacterium]MBL8196881.1 HlyD family efflux transporter periplasmic adaptor subunit [Blastocatellia bacterium]